MIKVLFVCYGNICRSPMAEFLFKDFVKRAGKEGDFYIESAATSSEEAGNPVHYGTRKILDRLNIDYTGKRARKITLSDYGNFDYIIGMDSMNIKSLRNFFGGDKDNKIYKMLDFCSDGAEDVADPWYTGDFEKTYEDISRGIKAFYDYVEGEEQIK